MRIKKLLSTMLAIVMMVSLGAVPAFAEIDWNSTSISINTVDELKTFAEKVNAGNKFEGQTVILEQSLDLTGDLWTPIGNGQRSGKSYIGYAFQGIFDGGNHTISGLSIANTENVDHAMGLFGVVDGGTVKNLTLNTVSISSNSECIGAAVGLAVGGATVQAINVSGTISAADGVGGIVGRMTVEGTIENCTNNAAVTATGNGAGGIVGKAYYTEASKEMNILQCTNTGVIKSQYGAGGIASLSAANVIGCTNSGEISVDRENATTEAGGIVGEQSTFARSAAIQTAAR